MSLTNSALSGPVRRLRAHLTHYRMDQYRHTKDQRDFVRVVQVGTALALGVMAAFLYSLKQVHPSIHLEFTIGTVVTFLATAAFSWVFCSVLFKGEFVEGEAAQFAAIKRRRVVRWTFFFIVVSSLSTGGAFLYSLKDVSSENRREVIEGAGFAVVVLTIGGFFIHKAVRFFEEQSAIDLEMIHKDDDQHDT